MKKLLLISLTILPFTLLGQLKIGGELTVVHFNAKWNATNDVKWLWGLEDVKVRKWDIAADTKSQAKYEIIVVPTIIIFNEGKEVKRYQADISFSMKATKEDIQDKIDEILMESY